MQVGITLLFWPVAFLDGYFIPAFKEDHKQFSMAKWLLKYHQKCLWTQLFFSVALCVAGLAIQVQQLSFIGTFESASLISSVTVSSLCLLETTISFDGKFDRPTVYSFGFFVVAACAFITAIAPAWKSGVELLLEACATFVVKSVPAWSGSIIPPYSSMIVDMSIILTASALLLGMWFCLGKSLSRSVRKFLVTFVGCLALYLTYEACSSLQTLFHQRRDLDWDGQTGQNDWGVGQIGAPFAWAPLLFDMAYATCTTTSAIVTNRWRSTDHGYVLGDVERGTVQLDEASDELGGLPEQNVNDGHVATGCNTPEQRTVKAKDQKPGFKVDEQDVTDGGLTLD
jgi:hypothetical protein